MTDQLKGIIAIVIACVVWGLSPLFYALVAHVPAGEVFAHRTIWSVVLFTGVLAVQGRLSDLRGCFADAKTMLILLCASVMIACNWLLFIVSVQIGRVVESSLGYYIFPLVAVVLGWLLFGEQLSRMQKLCVGLAALAVATLSFGLGIPPWIALVLATTFGAYSVLKKFVTLGPVVSVTAEVLLLAPFAVLWLLGLSLEWWQEGGRAPAVWSMDWRTLVLLMLAGPMTAIPLILFSYSARRVALSTIGVVQYLNPTLQFGCAVLIFGEAFTGWHALAFGLIWIAVTLYSVSGYAAERRARKAAMAVSVVG
ncbi:EamA family transporter RarD [Algirhabdus cladophorae]|uniref:EamA family transporter RarD n=1 Tax=Algirhabdus cladophorae TaxID=3377108 RepID=UPI003B84AD28